jgi:hypothetical protein
MNKSTAKKTTSVTHVILGQAAVTDPVPTEKAPTPPEYTPVKFGRGSYVKSAQETLATKMASELKAYPDYKEVFGTTAPDPATIAAALETAQAWSTSLANATAWFQYVRQETVLAWRHALGLTDSLQGPFDLAIGRNATVAEALPSTAKFFDVPKEIAKKAVATRKKNRLKKASASAATPAVTAAGSKAVN